MLQRLNIVVLIQVAGQPVGFVFIDTSLQVPHCNRVEGEQLLIVPKYTYALHLNYYHKYSYQSKICYSS